MSSISPSPSLFQAAASLILSDVYRSSKPADEWGVMVIRSGRKTCCCNGSVRIPRGTPGGSAWGRVSIGVRVREIGENEGEGVLDDLSWTSASSLSKSRGRPGSTSPSRTKGRASVDCPASLPISYPLDGEDTRKKSDIVFWMVL